MLGFNSLQLTLIIKLSFQSFRERSLDEFVWQRLVGTTCLQIFVHLKAHYSFWVNFTCVCILARGTLKKFLRKWKSEVDGTRSWTKILFMSCSESRQVLPVVHFHICESLPVTTSRKHFANTFILDHNVSNHFALYHCARYFSHLSCSIEQRSLHQEAFSMSLGSVGNDNSNRICTSIRPTFQHARTLFHETRSPIEFVRPRGGSPVLEKWNREILKQTLHCLVDRFPYSSVRF